MDGSEAIFKIVPANKAAVIYELAEALKIFEAASDKYAAAERIAARFAPLGIKGLSYKSLCRKLADYRELGELALVDARTRRLVKTGLATNDAFMEHWHGTVFANRRKMRPAWSDLIRRFCGGDDIPGVGTWRELYSETYGYSPSVGEPCPWSELDPPPGWSYRNLVSLAPTKTSRLAVARGLGAAIAQSGIKVEKTRAGLSCCRVVEIDDFVWEQKVIHGRNREPQRAMGFSALDRLTAHTICYLGKPVRERDDGTRENLRSAWVRYIYHYVLCVTGVPKDGCVFMGEHGTAAKDSVFASAIVAINAARKAQGLGLIDFRSGSIIPRALAKGLPKAAAKGSPRNKGGLEEWHALIKNEMGAVLGEIGGGREAKLEYEPGMVAESKRLIQMAGALESSRPGISARIAHPFLHWPDFQAAAYEAIDRVDNRKLHSLEGWEECGFVLGQLRHADSPHWLDMPALERLSPERAAAVRQLVESGAAEYRVRKMSPAEAWKARRGELSPIAPFFAPLILGEELSQVCRVSDQMKLIFNNFDTGERYAVAAIAGGNTLVRGEQYRVWINPMDSGKAYVSDMQGFFIGVAPVMPKARADADAHDCALRRQLGVRQAVLADERRRLMPAIRRQLAAANERAAANIAAFGLDDPVAAAEIEGRRRDELRGVEGADVTLDAPEEPGEAADVAIDEPGDEPTISQDDFG